MKIFSPLTKTVLSLGILVSTLVMGIHTVNATGGGGQHSEWKYTGSSEWSSCVPISDQCNEHRGKKTRTLNYVCEKKWGNGWDQCEFTKSCSTGIERDHKCVRECYRNENGCFWDGGRKWKDVGYTYTPGTKTETDRQFCWVPDDQVKKCAVEPTPTPDVTPDPTEEPSPEPTSTPESSPTPDDGQSGHRSSLATDHFNCETADFEAVMDLKWDGQGKGDIKVTFNFNGDRKEATTNQDGRARVSYGRNSGTLTAEASDYPSQSMNLTAPENCPATSDSSETSRTGQVLGISTLASTGNSAQQMAIFSLLAGAAITAYAVYAFRQN